MITKTEFKVIRRIINECLKYDYCDNIDEKGKNCEYYDIELQRCYFSGEPYKWIDPL